MRKVLLTLALIASTAHAEDVWPERLVRIEDMKLQTSMTIEVPRRRPSGDVKRPVVLRAHVGSDGRVRHVLIDKSSGSPGHDAAAMKAMKQQRFEPYVVEGMPTEVTLVVPLNLPKTGLRYE